MTVLDAESSFVSSTLEASKALLLQKISIQSGYRVSDWSNAQEWEKAFDHWCSYLIWDLAALISGQVVKLQLDSHGAVQKTWCSCGKPLCKHLAASFSAIRGMIFTPGKAAAWDCDYLTRFLLDCVGLEEANSPSQKQEVLESAYLYIGDPETDPVYAGERAQEVCARAAVLKDAVTAAQCCYLVIEIMKPFANQIFDVEDDLRYTEYAICNAEDTLQLLSARQRDYQ